MKIEGDEEVQLTVDDILAEAGEEVQYHTLLEVWQVMLAGAEIERSKKITPQEANRITSTYRELNFADMPLFQTRYFDKIAELREVLEAIIAGDEECLKKATPAEDAQENNALYRQALTDWQRVFLSWELNWNTADQTAAVELAAISEVHRLMFGDTGIVSFLDNIPFEYTEADQQELAAALLELRDSWEG